MKTTVALTVHYEEITITKLDRSGRCTLDALVSARICGMQLERAGGSKGDRSNDGGVAELWDVVAVAVWIEARPRSIGIDDDTVGHPTQRLDEVDADSIEGRRKLIHGLGFTLVGVGDARITEAGHVVTGIGTSGPTLVVGHLPCPPWIGFSNDLWAKDGARMLRQPVANEKETVFDDDGGV